MPNRLSMAKIHSIETLHASGHSNREIARLLGVDRGTVNGYVKRLKSRCEPDRSENQPNPHTGSGGQEEVAHSGPKSQCDAYRDQIEAKLDAGLSIQRIHGTTKRQVRRQFEEVERDALLALPRDRFPQFRDPKRTANS